MTTKLSRTFCVCLMLLASAVYAEAQTRTAARTQEPSPRQGAESRTNADEDFELNITERRITEANFEASTEVEIGGAGERGVNLKVGVAVGAESIDVLLRNVRGRVRFRASLEPVLRRTRARREADTTPLPSPRVFTSLPTNKVVME